MPVWRSRSSEKRPLKPLHRAVRASRAWRLTESRCSCWPCSLTGMLLQCALTCNMCLQVLALNQNCLKLASENKINKHNSWSLGLIDHLSDLVKPAAGLLSLVASPAACVTAL